MDNTLWSLSYYHGYLPKSEAVKFVLSNGDFLIRKCIETQNFIITRVQQNIEENIQIITSNNKYYFDENGIGKRSIKELIENYMAISLNKIQLLNPIGRQSWELSDKEIKKGPILGTGAFGSVTKGNLKMLKDDLIVAVKESLNNKNILLIIEYCKDGSLSDYLRRHQTSIGSKLYMVMGISYGLQHIHLNNILHNDLAARNCLYSDRTVKISDFGLSKKLPKGQESINVQKGQNLPIKWLSKETILNKTLTKANDVYAFGVAAFEIFNNGLPPYPNLSTRQAAKKIIDGEVLTFSKDTPKEFSEFITTTIFKKSERDRSTISEVVNGRT